MIRHALAATLVICTLVLPRISWAGSDSTSSLGELVAAAGLVGLAAGTITVAAMGVSIARDRPTHSALQGFGLGAAVLNVIYGTLALALTPFIFDGDTDRLVGFVAGGVFLALGITGWLLALAVETRAPSQRYSVAVGPGSVGAAVRF